MKKLYLLLVLVVGFFSLPLVGKSQTSAITFSGGERLGDKLKTYIKAHYCAYRVKLPFLGHRFPYSDQFFFHTVEPYFEKTDIPKKFSEIWIFPFHELETFVPPAKPTLFSVSYTINCGEFIESINDKKFIAHIQKMLSPRFPQPSLELPSDKICVAVHVRKGGGYDVPPMADGMSIDQDFKAQGVSNRRNLPSDKVWPLKFPPDSFYIRQICKLSEMVGDRPLYIFIFTDDQHPDRIAQKFQHAVAKPNITFAHRQGEYDFEDCVLEDFFAMTHFDCIIRPDSAFSQIAEFIGNHAVAIKPTRASWKKDTLSVDKITIKIKYPAATALCFDRNKFKNDRCYTYEIIE